MYRVISFDCANKTLGVVVADVIDPKTLMTQIDTLFYNICLSRNESNIAQMYANICAIHTDVLNLFPIVVHDSQCIDIIPGDKVRDVPKPERTRLMRIALDKIAKKWCDPQYNTVICVEKQIDFNSHSTTAQDQINMFFDLYSHEHGISCTVVEISPKLKNNLKVSPHDIKEYKKKYAKKSDANKAFAVDVAQHLTTKFPRGAPNFNIMPRKLRNHVADAYLQILCLWFKWASIGDTNSHAHD